MKAIIAINNLGFIGLNNKLPWHNSDDLKHFKKLTYNCVLLAGYNTYSSLPCLKNRNIILDDRHKYIDSRKIDWCIGGKATYDKYMHLFTEIHISYINNNITGDTLSPDLSKLNKNCKIFTYNF